MQGNARGTYEWVYSAWECRELPGECKVAGVKCYGKGNAKECQGNIRERMQIARGMQRNARECQGNVSESVSTAR